MEARRVPPGNAEVIKREVRSFSRRAGEADQGESGRTDRIVRIPRDPLISKTDSFPAFLETSKTLEEVEQAPRKLIKKDNCDVCKSLKIIEAEEQERLRIIRRRIIEDEVLGPGPSRRVGSQTDADEDKVPFFEPINKTAFDADRFPLGSPSIISLLITS